MPQLTEYVIDCQLFTRVAGEFPQNYSPGFFIYLFFTQLFSFPTLTNDLFQSFCWLVVVDSMEKSQLLLSRDSHIMPVHFLTLLNLADTVVATALRRPISWEASHPGSVILTSRKLLCYHDFYVGVRTISVGY